MECERLNRLVRSWYVQVQDEALAPARMVEFMEKHLEGCSVCLADPDIRYEVKKITEIVLPPSKITKPANKADQDEDDSKEPETDDDGDDDSEDQYDDDDDDSDDDEDPDMVDDDSMD